CFEPVAGAPDLAGASAVAARGHRVAISDAQGHRVFLLARSGEQVVAAIDVADPGPVAFSASALLVAVRGEKRLRRYDPPGGRLEDLPATLPDGAVVDRIAIGGNGAVWIVTRHPDGSLGLWRARHATRFHAASVGDLARAFPKSGIVVAQGGAFCLAQLSAHGIDEQRCFDVCGDCIAGPVAPPPPPPRQTHGQLLTLPIDSGIPRCRWHRVRIDA